MFILHQLLQWCNDSEVLAGCIWDLFKAECANLYTLTVLHQLAHSVFPALKGETNITVADAFNAVDTGKLFRNVAVCC